jgi:phage terminase small subunit
MRLTAAKKDGPKAVPRVILEKRGSKRVRQRREDGELIPEGIPSAPKWLDPEAKPLWSAIAKDIAPLGLLTVLDATMFAALVEGLRDYIVAKNAPEGTLTSRREARKHLTQLAREFGLTPSSRVGMPVRQAVPSARPAHGNAKPKLRDKSRYFSTLPTLGGQ